MTSDPVMQPSPQMPPALKSVTVSGKRHSQTVGIRVEFEDTYGAFREPRWSYTPVGGVLVIVREGGTFREVHYAPGTWETVVAEV